ncbi:hypothetical protein [Pseudomonas sp. G5(2012)]|uniref:hypothetical protein n=1 Tax=Pseudomonas sp. G5(2012) TaxID=1268068 RepID=UPI0005B354A3|nr:hypothetical protein [Pseudomonas sp. G5(2012)]
MDETQLANEIAHRVISDTKFWVGIIGLIGAVIGSLLTICGNILLHWLQGKPQKDLEKSRINMLKTMLKDPRFPQGWRKLTTLSAVIGASDEETKRLLVKAGARGSEANDGMWGLIDTHPFPDEQ